MVVEVCTNFFTEHFQMQYSLLCALLWATTGIFVKSIPDMSIAQILFGRFLIALLFIFIINQLFTKKSHVNDNKNIQIKSNFFIKLILALLMIFYYLCATYSFIYTPIALATLLMSLSPCVAIIYKIISREKIQLAEILGFLIAFAGVALYIYPTLNLDNTHQHFLFFGCLLAFLAAVFKAVNAMLIWNYKDKLNPKDFNIINQMTYLLASLIMGISLIYSNNPFALSSFSIVLIVLLGIFSTALPSILNNLASQKINPVLNTIIGMLTPLFAAIMAWIFLDESLSFWSIFSLFISLFGVFLIAVYKK